MERLRLAGNGDRGSGADCGQRTAVESKRGRVVFVLLDSDVVHRLLVWSSSVSFIVCNLDQS